MIHDFPDLPPFRQQADYTAYVEGWGLYAERLGKDVGLYKAARRTFLSLKRTTP